QACAENFAQTLKVGDIIALKGNLGAGKTAFARAIIQSLCGPDTIVPSPTFTLVQTYQTPKTEIWHFDLYRLEDPLQAEELGIEEAFAQGISLIEWPERLGDLLPDHAKTLEFTIESDGMTRCLKGLT
ncbi:MAG: tRNA (adenosine(37)-N6)-threonylcarbamoyltransferase complex ATPase subunit type 1 TsaE, partial [bacterium]|nr:tRNA (adenosine(37)-N6)-threonylcarbamoyltransferase complex ATPase subunit type 1 TsaE [bacterium]